MHGPGRNVIFLYRKLRKKNWKNENRIKKKQLKKWIAKCSDANYDPDLDNNKEKKNQKKLLNSCKKLYGHDDGTGCSRGLSNETWL